MSLRLQLVATIAIVLLATLALGALLVHWHAVEKVETEMRAAIEVGARTARNAVDDVDDIANPRRRLERLVADFEGDRHLMATMLDPDGRVLRSSRVDTSVSPAPAWLERWLTPPPRRVEVALPPIFSTLGTLVLESNARNEIAEVWDDLLVYAKLLAVYSVSGLGLTLLVLTQAMRPLRELDLAIARIGIGDFTAHLSESGPTELARLASGFNDMTQRLSKAEARNRQLVDQLTRVQEEERAELARNLHDEVSPLLFSVDVDASSIRHLAGQGQAEDIEAKASSILAAVRSLKGNVRGIIEQLRPFPAEVPDWRAAIEEVVEFWKLRFPLVTFDLRLADLDCPPGVAVALKYLAIEAIGNALKHAAPKRVTVRVAAAAGTITACVSDDGGGLRTGGPRSGYGLVGMRERVERAGGVLELIESSAPSGIEIMARFPVAAAAATVDASPSEVGR